MNKLKLPGLYPNDHAEQTLIAAWRPDYKTKRVIINTDHDKPNPMRTVTGFVAGESRSRLKVEEMHHIDSQLEGMQVCHEVAGLKNREMLLTAEQSAVVAMAALYVLAQHSEGSIQPPLNETELAHISHVHMTTPIGVYLSPAE